MCVSFFYFELVLCALLSFNQQICRGVGVGNCVLAFKMGKNWSDTFSKKIWAYEGKSGHSSSFFDIFLCFKGRFHC